MSSSFHRVPYLEPGYATHAAAANIAIRLKEAKANLRLAQRQVDWLTELLEHRQGQTDEEWSAEVAEYRRQQQAASPWPPRTAS